MNVPGVEISDEVRDKVSDMLDKIPGSGMSTIAKQTGLPPEEVAACLGLFLMQRLVRYKTNNWSHGVYWWFVDDWGESPNLNDLWNWTRDNHPDLKAPVQRKPGDPTAMISKAQRLREKHRKIVLEVLTKTEEPLKLVEICERSRLPMRTVQRLTTVLQREGVAQYNLEHTGAAGRPARLWHIKSTGYDFLAPEHRQDYTPYDDGVGEDPADTGEVSSKVEIEWEDET